MLYDNKSEKNLIEPQVSQTGTDVENDDDFEFVDRDEKDKEAIVRPSTSYWPDVWRRLKGNRLAMTCLAVIVFLIVMSVFAPIFSKYEYDATNLTKSNLEPCAEHWFGTDSVGRDMWTRIWVGSRVSLMVGFIGAILPFVLGMIVGAIAGWFGGWVDMIIMRIIDIGLCIPSMIYVILIILYFGGGAHSLVLAMAIMGWMGSARGFRGRVLQFKNREFTLAARTLGASPMRIIFRHILPNILGNMAVSLTSFVPSVIFMEAGLSFIGLGIAPPMTSLGQLASDGAGKYRTFFYQFAIPSIVISIIIFAFFMFGNCLRDALDPQLRDQMLMNGKRKKVKSQ
ncbi:MAG: ABC transporter permease [Eubacteriales bacterium]|jgi:oligopeptide transport system permease protein